MKSEHNTQIIEIENTNHQISTDTEVPASIGGFQTTASPKPKDTDVRDLLKTLIERKWFIISLTLVGTLISFIITLSTVPLYRAEAIVKIDPEDKKVLNFDVSTSGGATKSEQYFKTQLKLLKSKALAKKVIDNLELDSNSIDKKTEIEKPFFSELLQKLKDTLQGKKVGENTKLSKSFDENPQIRALEQSFLSRLNINALGKSYLVNVSFDSEEPELAATVVNSLIQNFIDSNLDGRLDSASHAKIFLSDEIKTAKAKLDEAEQQMLQFEREKNIITTGSRSLITQKLENLNSALTRATQQRIAAEAAYGESSKVIKQKTANTNNVIRALNKELAQLNNEYQQNLKIYKPAYPLMLDIQHNITQIKQSITEEKRNLQKANASVNVSTGNPAATKLKIARSNEAALKEELEKAKAESLSARDNSIKYDSLKHEVASHRGLYESLLKRQKEVGVAGGVDNNNISVVDPAVAPFTPHTPNTQLNLMLGTLLGLFTSSLIALFLGHKDERIKSIEDIAKVSDLPVLGVFPFVKSSASKNKLLLMSEHASSMVAESFRSLRTNLQFSTTKGMPKILHITSSEPGEGKSHTTLNLATVVAQTKARVLVIDADLRNPSIHRYLDIGESTNLGEGLLHGKKLNEMVIQTSIPYLSIIAGEPVKSTPADLLSSNDMVDLLKDASDSYDLVIVDSPPVMGLADALVIANRSMATLFVVSSHQTKQSQLQTALKRLQMGFGNVVGFVFTKAKDVQSTNYSYSYGGQHLKDRQET